MIHIYFEDTFWNECLCCFTEEVGIKEWQKAFTDTKKGWKCWLCCQIVKCLHGGLTLGRCGVAGVPGMPSGPGIWNTSEP